MAHRVRYKIAMNNLHHSSPITREAYDAKYKMVPVWIRRYIGEGVVLCENGLTNTLYFEAGDLKTIINVEILLEQVANKGVPDKTYWLGEQ